MKTAEQYVKIAEAKLIEACQYDGEFDPRVMRAVAEAGVYQGLAQVAATLEAARLMAAPTPEDQARLAKLVPWATSDSDNCPAVTRAESEMWDRHV